MPLYRLRTCRLTDGQIDRLKSALVLAIAMALPWELFQRIPMLNATITKLAGGLLVLVVLTEMRLKKRWTLPRTGIEAPLALLGVVMVATTALSQNPAVSLSQLAVYATYFAVFYAVAATVSTPARARCLAAAFLASAAAVGMVAILCRVGILTPTLVDTTRITGRWTSGQAWFDLTSRMAPVSADYNQGALPLLAAFCLGLFLFLAPPGRLARKSAALILALFAFAGVFITLSRSAIAIALVLVLAFIIAGWNRGNRRTALALLFATLLAAAALLILIQPGGVIKRALAFTEDSSYHSRISALKAGVMLWPRFWLTGTGLGVSDAVIARSPYGPEAGGITVHSVPLKILLETGIPGLAALIWLGYAMLRKIIRPPRDESPTLRNHRTAFLALFLTFFAITAVQPFMALAIFPFFAAVALGPMSSSSCHCEETCSDTGTSTKQSRRYFAWPRTRLSSIQRLNVPQPAQQSPPLPSAWVAAITVAVAAVVIYNAADFHRTLKRATPLAETLLQAVTAEQNGDWQKAAAAYQSARAAAVAGQPRPLLAARFFPAATEVLDFAYLYERMAVRFRRLDPLAAAAYGQGRAALALGDSTAAIASFEEAAKREKNFAQAHFAMAEVLWQTGRYEDALAAYRRARQTEPVRENARFRTFAANIDSEIRALQSRPATIPSLLRRAELLRRRARWSEALDAYTFALTNNPRCPEALFNLGVQAELDHKTEKARALYRLALDQNPQHAAADRRLKILAQMD